MLKKFGLHNLLAHFKKMKDISIMKTIDLFKSFKFKDHELKILFRPHLGYIAKTATDQMRCGWFTPIIEKDGIETEALREINFDNVIKLLDEILPILDIQNFCIGVLTLKGAVKYISYYNK